MLPIVKKLKTYLDNNEWLLQEELAKQVGVSGAAMSYWIRNLSEPTKNSQMKIQKFLDKVAGPVEKIEKVIEQTPVRQERFVRVSFKVQTLTDVLDRANQYGSVVIEEGSQLYQVTKLGEQKQ